MLRCILIGKDGNLFSNMLYDLVRLQAPILDHPSQQDSNPQHVHCSMMGQGRATECNGTVRSMETPSSCNTGSFMLNVLNMCADMDGAFSPYFKLKLISSIFLHVFRTLTDTCRTKLYHWRLWGQCPCHYPICSSSEKRRRNFSNCITF